MGNKELNKEGMFYTRDLACAAYLKTNGFPLEVERLGHKGVFYYAEELQPEVDKFFKGDGLHLEFAGNMRGLKSQIQNTRAKEVTDE